MIALCEVIDNESFFANLFSYQQMADVNCHRNCVCCEKISYFANLPS